MFSSLSVECSSWVKYHLVLSPGHSARVHKTYQKCNSPTQSLSAKTFTSSAIGMSRSLLGILSQILWRCNFGSLVQVQVYGLTKKEWGWVKHFRLLVYVFSSSGYNSFFFFSLGCGSFPSIHSVFIIAPDEDPAPPEFWSSILFSFSFCQDFISQPKWYFCDNSFSQKESFPGCPFTCFIFCLTSPDDYLCFD